MRLGAGNITAPRPTPIYPATGKTTPRCVNRVFMNTFSERLCSRIFKSRRGSRIFGYTHTLPSPTTATTPFPIFKMMSKYRGAYKSSITAAGIKAKRDRAIQRARQIRDTQSYISRNPRILMAPGALVGHRGEIKTLDIPASANTISTTATFQALNIIQEGSAFYNRIGRKIMMKSIRLTGQIVPSGNIPGPSSEYLRIMLVYDRQPNGAYPTASDLLTSYDNTGATTSTSFSHLNMNNCERFVVLRDCRIGIPSDGTAAATNQVQAIVDPRGDKYNIDMYVKLKDLETHYKASSNPAVIGDQASGALLLFLFGNVAAAAAAYNLAWSSRLRYHDV